MQWDRVVDFGRDSAAGERLSSQRCIACHRELEDRIDAQDRAGAIAMTLEHVKTRKAFGATLYDKKIRAFDPREMARLKGEGQSKFDDSRLKEALVNGDDERIRQEVESRMDLEALRRVQQQENSDRSELVAALSRLTSATTCHDRSTSG